MRTLVVGDIHGAYKALLQVLERSGFDKEKDKLICLGDVVDGWSESIEVIRELASIKNLVYIIGNHDQWFIDFLIYGIKEYMWISQGGRATYDAYLEHMEAGFIDEMISFFKKGHYYYVEDERLFVHGGYNWHRPIEDSTRGDLMWDRHLYQTALMWGEWSDKDKGLNIVKDYKEVFIGHTSTSYTNPDLKPVHAANVWNLDQGAGWEGKLTIMDVETKEYWQSDMVKDLYPDERGRM